MTADDKLRRALHAEARTAFVCNPHALDDIRARTAANTRRTHLLAVAALLLILLLTLGGS